MTGYKRPDNRSMKRSAFSVIERRRELVARLVTRRLSIREIVDALGKQGEVNPLNGKPWSRDSVHQDIKALEKNWRESYSKEIAEHKAKQLADLEEVIRQGWMDRDMGVVLAAMAQKAVILGLNAPTKIDITERVREIATEAGIDPDEAVREAQRIVASRR